MRCKVNAGSPSVYKASRDFEFFDLPGGVTRSQTTRATSCATPGCIILFYITALIDFLLSIRGASLRNIVAALCPTEGQTPQEPFKFTRDILPFLARFVNLDEGVIGGKKIRAGIFRNLTSGR
jgi:hypothetical protein